MRILLVEDEPGLAGPLVALLRRERYEVVWADNTPQARAQVDECEPDLIALDVMLPEGEDAGFRLARQLRLGGFTGAILFLTARDVVEDRVYGLDLGGDDYLVKPFSLEEFLARVRALLRRGGTTRQSVFERGPLRIEFDSRKVYWNRRLVSLSDKEFALLERLALYPERVFGVDELLEKIFPDAESGHRILRVYVHRLREKLGEDVITTLPGGYALGV
ncbi:response regulator transcription factor [Meiothermus rufus]|uniref:response regulator transcription factor n=1 Tax=Meiothermus rufus TaxID=604332 RepID=UPI0004273A5C|nr:response regulator transcription factor [Meiothermus rufus]